MAKIVVVTGGAGFIGSHLCDLLIGKGFKVVCIDNLITGSKKNISHLQKNENFEFLQKDDTLIYNYKNQNREWLFLYLHQIYLDFKNNHNITNLYIHNLDKTNFLRAHNRKLHSDKIERFTLNNAVDTGGQLMCEGFYLPILLHPRRLLRLHHRDRPSGHIFLCENLHSPFRHPLP